MTFFAHQRPNLGSYNSFALSENSSNLPRLRGGRRGADKRRETSEGCRGVRARSTLTKFLSHLDARPGKVTLPRRVIELFDVLSGVYLLSSRRDVPLAFAEPLPETFLLFPLALLSARRDRLPGRFGDLLITPRGGRRGREKKRERELNHRREAERTSDAFETSGGPSFLQRFIYSLFPCVSADVAAVTSGTQPPSATRWCNTLAVVDPSGVEALVNARQIVP